MFHYTTQEGLLGILRSKKLWLVSSREMNDVTDRFYANLFVTTALFSSNDEDATLLRNNLSAEDILRINMDTLEVPFYSASFCENNSNEYLWQKYADGNKGVCIEIDDNYFNTYKDKVVKEMYESLDAEDIPENEIIIEKREVKYNYPIEYFLVALKLTKKCCISEKDMNAPDGYTKIQFENWLFLTLTLLAGTIKAENFSKEDEVRLLFQNRYTDEYVNKHSMYFLVRYRLTKILKELGVDAEISDGGKRRMELNIDKIFNENFIKSITIGDGFSGNIQELKVQMNQAGLLKTVLQNRKGKQL